MGPASRPAVSRVPARGTAAIPVTSGPGGSSQQGYSVSGTSAAGSISRIESNLMQASPL